MKRSEIRDPDVTVRPARFASRSRITKLEQKTCDGTLSPKLDPGRDVLLDGCIGRPALLCAGRSYRTATDGVSQHKEPQAVCHRCRRDSARASPCDPDLAAERRRLFRTLEEHQGLVYARRCSHWRGAAARSSRRVSAVAAAVLGAHDPGRSGSERCTSYIDYSPVKHGLVSTPAAWPYSSLHRYVRAGLLPADLGGHGGDDSGHFGERED